MTVRAFTTNELRFAAESADGIRNEPAVLVIKVVNGKEELQVIPESRMQPTDTALLNLNTPPRGAGVPGDAKALFLWENRVYGHSVPHFDKADALFLTQSAVEKFVLPYYMRFKSGAQVQGLENMLFNDPNVKAAFHIPGSLLYPFEFGYVKPDKTNDNMECSLV